MIDQTIEKPMVTSPIETIDSRSLSYLKLPHHVTKKLIITFHYFYDTKANNLWFNLDDVYFISRRKHKIVLSSVLNERHYKTFNVVQEDIKSTHTIFVDLNGVFAILNKSEDDIRDFYTDCIIDYFVKPGIGKPKSSIRKEIKRQRGETK